MQLMFFLNSSFPFATPLLSILFSAPLQLAQRIGVTGFLQGLGAATVIKMRPQVNVGVLSLAHVLLFLDPFGSIIRSRFRIFLFKKIYLKH